MTPMTTTTKHDCRGSLAFMPNGPKSLTKHTSHFILQANSDYYEYMRKAVCRIHFNPCDSPEGGYPCHEKCREIHERCPEDFLPYAEFNTCEFLPSRKEYKMCFWKDVTCSKPRTPTHGSIEVTNVALGGQAVYDCNVFFQLRGSKVRTCQVIVQQYMR